MSPLELAQIGLSLSLSRRHTRYTNITRCTVLSAKPCQTFSTLWRRIMGAKNVCVRVRKNSDRKKKIVQKWLQIWMSGKQKGAAEKESRNESDLKTEQKFGGSCETTSYPSPPRFLALSDIKMEGSYWKNWTGISDRNGITRRKTIHVSRCRPAEERRNEIVKRRRWHIVPPPKLFFFVPGMRQAFGQEREWGGNLRHGREDVVG